MKKVFGAIEILVAFLLITLIVGGFMQMSLLQMQESKLEQTKLEESKRFTQAPNEEKKFGDIKPFEVISN